MRRAIFVANGNAQDGAAGIEGSYWTIMGRDIAAALAERGCQLAVLNIAREEDQQVLFPTLIKGPLPDAFILFNFLPLISAGDDGATGLIGKLPCRVICICLDHPIHLAPALREQVAIIAANPALAAQRWFGVMEAEHIPAIEMLGIARDRIFVMAQAGPPPAPQPRPLAERSIPLLFAGSIAPMDGEEAFAHGLGMSATADRQVLAAALAETIDGERDVFAIVRDRLAPLIANDKTKDLFALATLIDKRARLVRRRRLLLGLRYLPINFCGEIDPAFLARFPAALHRGRLSFTETLALMRDTRVVINDTINLRSSALIRFFYAVAEGCVLASETNRFLVEAFPPGRALIALDGRDDDNAGRVGAVIGDPASLQPLAEEARARLARAHTWSRRVDGLLAALEA